MFSRSILAGVPRETLQEWLTRAQHAYAALMTGSKAESVTYTQGNGSRSVTYSRANLQDLGAFIELLQRQLGIARAPRRALRPYYR